MDVLTNLAHCNPAFLTGNGMLLRDVFKELYFVNKDRW